MKYKQGITAVSVVVYVILLFAFTALALSVSTNLSSGLFEDKGIAINLSNYDKVLYYLNKNAIESSGLEFENNTLKFSNGNEFKYDADSQTIYYNDGIFAKDIKGFTVTMINNNQYTVEVQFIKYLNEMTRSIKIYVGE